MDGEKTIHSFSCFTPLQPWVTCAKGTSCLAPGCWHFGLRRGQSAHGLGLQVSSVMLQRSFLIHQEASLALFNLQKLEILT